MRDQDWRFWLTALAFVFWLALVAAVFVAITTVP